MMRLNYGTMPTLQYFRLRYGTTFRDEGAAATIDEGMRLRYEISHGTAGGGERPRAGSYSCDELWAELKRLRQIFEEETGGYTDTQRDEAGDWIASILYTLGIEWV